MNFLRSATGSPLWGMFDGSSSNPSAATARLPDSLLHLAPHQAWGDLVVNLSDLDHLTDPTTATAGKHVIAVLDHTFLGNLGLAGTLAPAVAAVSGLTGRLDSLLEPVVSYHFTPDGLNEFDPSAHAFNSLAREMTGLLAPVIDGIVETGLTAGLLTPLTLQIGSPIDGVSGLLHTSLTTLLPELMNGDALMPVHGLLSGELLHETVRIPETGFFSDAHPLAAAPTLETAHSFEPVSSLLMPTTGGDLLHVQLVTPITSVAGGAGDTASLTPLTHVLHGLL